MSIEIIDNTVFLAVARKMFEASKAVTINEDYYPCCKKLTRQKACDLAASWYNLNIDSYENAYGGTEELPEWKELIFCPTPPTPKAVQFYKWLQAIRYNINHKCIPSNNQQALWDIIALDRLIKEVSAAIIQQLPDYSVALWDTYQ